MVGAPAIAVYGREREIRSLIGRYNHAEQRGAQARAAKLPAFALAGRESRVHLREVPNP